MMSFQSYIDSCKKKFVGLFFTKESQKALQTWAEVNGFDLSVKFSGEKQNPADFDFHTTIFFTTTEHDTKTGTFKIEPFELKFKSFELLGVDKNIPVIKIDTDNEQLQKIRQRFVNQGYKDAWPDYKPHISLSHKYTGTPDVSKLELPKIKVVADSIQIADQE